MEYDQIIRELNKLFAHAEKEAVDIAAQANHVLSHFSMNDVPKIHGDISEQAVAGLYSVLDHLALPDEAKEHLIFRYYMLLIQASGEGGTDHIVKQVMMDYEKLSFLALESIVIHLLKEDKISEGNLKSCNEPLKAPL